MSRLYLVVVLAATFVFLLVPALNAQTPPNPNAGSILWSTNDFGINLATGGIKVDIPLRSKMGAIPFSSRFFGTSQAYTANNLGGVGTEAQFYVGTAVGPYSDVTSVTIYALVSNGTCPQHPTETYDELQLVSVIDETGASHPLGSVVWKQSNYCPVTPGPIVTGDGSGYTVVASATGTLNIYDRGGKHWDLNCGGGVCGVNVSGPSVVDPDGNTISYGAVSGKENITDTLNTPVLTVGSSVSGFGPTSYSYVDQNGVTQYYNINLTNIGYMQTNFACSNVVDISSGTVNYEPPTSLTLPNGGQYTFAYEPTPNGNGFTNTIPPTYFTGRIAKITYPSGGSIAYAYSGGNNGYNCSTGAVPKITVTLNDNNGTVSQYTYVNTYGSGNYFVLKTDPAGNQTLYYFSGQFQTQVMSYQGGCSTSIYSGCAGGGTLLKTVTTCYNGNLTSCASPSSVPNAEITETDVYTSLNGSSSSRVQTIYDCKASPTACYGNPVQVSQYDFGANSPTFQTFIYWGQSWNGSNACNAYPSGTYINNTPCYIQTQGYGNNVAITNIAYSNTGHPTSISKWNGTSNLTATANYNSNGTVNWTKDVAGNQTTYGGYTCNGILPTTITPAITALAATLTWDCNGGVLTSSTDANGAVTQFGYKNEGGTPDPLWRRLSVTDPLLNVTWTDYSAGATLPETVDTYLNFPSSNPTSTIDAFKTLDGFGRVVQSKERTAPSATTFDQTVQYTYGWTTPQTVGGPFTVPGPFTQQTIPGGTAVTTTQSEGAGRVASVTDGGGGTLTHTYTQNDDLFVLGPASAGENNKQVQNQYDGLGRLQYSCAIGNGSTTACGQATGSAKGVTDTYVYSSPVAGQTEVQVQRGSQTRTTYSDALGRVFKKITPEGGTWQYFYDSYGSCTTSGYTGAAGQLTAVKDPNGNLLCYGYDSLNRVTGVNANGTSCRHFYYDNSTGYSGSIPTGVTAPTNPYGRMVEAATDTCAANTLQTDEWFSYDKDGHILDQWQTSPHSTQYYHSTATYAGNGAITALQLASPSLYTMNYGLDGEGRWNTLSNGSSQVVTGPLPSACPPACMYDAAGRVLNVQLTGTTPDQDIFTYDPNTGRMKSFEFEVGNTPANLTGTLTWNANGSLAELQVVDGFNAGGSETCYSNSSSALGYGYDDLGRLVEFDCGSGKWGQQFSYDQYDNLTQTVIAGRTGATWNPGYNSANNQVTGSTYDSNGNMTNDGGSNVYGWNEFSKMKWTAGSGTPTCGTSGKCITYDAFGRIAETSAGSTWVERWYTQVGQVIMTGTTTQYGYWPSPGSGTVLVSGTTNNNFVHQDWLGTGRIVSSNNHTVTADRAYAPYGEQYNTFGYTNPYYAIFAGLTGNFDSGILFDTTNRELAQYQGRWVSPDPAGSGWNQYAYVTNPNSMTDPTGLGGPCQNIQGICAPLRNPDPYGGGCLVLDGGGACAQLIGSQSDWLLLTSVPTLSCSHGDCTPYYPVATEGILFYPSSCTYIYVCAPINNGQNPPPQPRKPCYASNSLKDKVVRTFSLLRLAETWEEWAAGGLAKISYFAVAQAGARSAGGAESLGAAAIGTTGTILGGAGTVTTIGATMADINCQIGPVDPYTEK